MRSMTGYGKASAASDGRTVIVELKSVNHRFLDINVNLPRQLGFVENSVRKVIESRLSRGRIEVNLFYRNERADSRDVLLNESLAKKYSETLEKLNAIIGNRSDAGFEGIAAMPDVLSVQDAPQDEEAITSLVLTALTQALDALCSMRNTEGEQMEKALNKHIDDIEELALQAENRYPEAMEECVSRLRKRLSQLISEGISEERIAQEIAILADKTAIDEEIVRLKAHVDHARQLCAQPEPSGRSLDFLVQEMNREVNTIASKSQDLTLTQIALKGKNTIEKLREQLQNVE
ncbi:MAG: YicC family protein [Clostridiales bacterium]|nr:YicC family protein [Clostridiales bacterium]